MVCGGQAGLRWKGSRFSVPFPGWTAYDGRAMSGMQVTAESLSDGDTSLAPDRAWNLPWSRGMIEAMRQLPVGTRVLLLLGLTGLVGWADFATGGEVTLFVFYAFPIALAVAVMGTRVGIVVAGLAGWVWWLANLDSHLYETQMGYHLAVVNRLFYFGVVVVAVSAVRTKQEIDAARIRALEERRQLERDLVRVSEHEQQRIGQDLHDGLCQRLAAIGCAARMLADDLKSNRVEEFRDADMIEAAIQEAVLEARSLARGISPVHVDSDSLPAALTDLAKSVNRLTGTAIEVRDCAEGVPFEPTVAMHLYRIAQEAVANAVRHSGASRVTIDLRVLPGEVLELRIEDDGQGLSPVEDQVGRGMGLSTMRYRSESVGGRLEIGPRAGGGTVVACRVSLGKVTKKQT